MTAHYNTSDAGGAPDPAPIPGKFLQKLEHGQERDPKHVHHPAHKQKRYKSPAAADAIGSVAGSFLPLPGPL